MGWFGRTTPFFVSFFVRINIMGSIEGGILMEKNDMTPIGCNNCLVYEEFNKEDLKDAGVVLEYKDDVIKQKGINDKNKTKTRKDCLRCLMFLFLVLSFLLLVFVGSLKISNEESEVRSGLEEGELTSLIIEKVAYV